MSRLAGRPHRRPAPSTAFLPRRILGRTQLPPPQPHTRTIVVFLGHKKPNPQGINRARARAQIILDPLHLIERSTSRQTVIAGDPSPVARPVAIAGDEVAAGSLEEVFSAQGLRFAYAATSGVLSLRPLSHELRTATLSRGR